MEKLKKHPKLNQWLATAICGNDILSSALYVSGIAIVFAGVFAPLVLLFIAFILFLYKKVYTEVVEALPINGGAYNCLLNGTSKTVAAVAGVMTILSYVATAVISAKVGVEYLHTLIPTFPIIQTTIALLLVFAAIVITGIKDSAKVAFAIFSLHVAVLLLFLASGLLFFLNGHSYFGENLRHTTEIISNQGNLLYGLYLAFSASLLGVSGFESSANFVEEQDKGVFRKTLRNMLIGVAFFNPLIALVVLNTLPFPAIMQAKDFLLAKAAFILGGPFLKGAVVIDAFLVLSGAVLTAYVGVSGLIHRMASDSCLPTFLIKQNKKEAFPRIIIAFFLLCSSILLLTHGNLLSLAGVYTIAFLGVMSLFAAGNLILKQTRTELKRTYSAPIFVVILAFLATLFGIFGNIRIDPNNLIFFELYFIPSVILILGMVYQDYVIRFLLKMTSQMPVLHNFLLKNFEDLSKGRFVVFVNHVDRLYNVLNYVNKNETGWNLILVHCRNWDQKSDRDRFNEIKRVLPSLQNAGVFPHFNIELVYEDTPFGPEAINNISRKFKVRKNRIMIGSIHHFHDFDYEDLGGVRIIF